MNQHTDLKVGETVNWITDEDTVLGVVVSVGERIELKTRFGLCSMPATDGRFERTNETFVPSSPATNSSPKKSKQVRSQTESSNGETKFEKALKIFEDNQTATRQELMALFINNLHMTPAGASTYAYKVKKEFSHGN